MRPRSQRALALVLALVVGAANIACACVAGAVQQQHAAIDPHACCKTSDQPAAPEPAHGDCPHCGHLTMAPAKAADHAIDLSPSLTVALISFDSVSPGLLNVAAPIVTPTPDSAPPSTLLRLGCALRL